MKTKLQRLALLSIMLLLFTACASDKASKPLSEVQKQINYIYSKTKISDMYFIEVPSANNIISEKIMLAAIQLNGSASVDALDGVLKKNDFTHIGVVGRSMPTNVVTIKQSLKNMQNKSARGTIYVIANDKEKFELEAMNKNSNINLVVISPD